MTNNVTLSIKLKKCFCKLLNIKDLRWGPTFCKSLRIKDLCKEGPQRNSLEDNDLRWFSQVVDQAVKLKSRAKCKKKSSLSGGFLLDWLS